MKIQSERPDLLIPLLWWIIDEFCANHEENDKRLIKTMYELAMSDLNLLSSAAVAVFCVDVRVKRFMASGQPFAELLMKFLMDAAEYVELGGTKFIESKLFNSLWWAIKRKMYTKGLMNQYAKCLASSECAVATKIALTHDGFLERTRLVDLLDLRDLTTTRTNEIFVAFDTLFGLSQYVSGDFILRSICCKLREREVRFAEENGVEEPNPYAEDLANIMEAQELKRFCFKPPFVNQVIRLTDLAVFAIRKMVIDEARTYDELMKKIRNLHVPPPMKQLILFK